MSPPATDAEALRRYADRWRAVQEAETSELRTTSAEMKLRQVEVLRGFLEALDRDALDREDEAVRDRWVRLREALGG